MTKYENVCNDLIGDPKTWLITGVAGFIGSNILEKLLLLDQNVVGLDNLSTGYQRNLDEVKGLVTPEQWKRFTFIQGDIRDYDTCQKVFNLERMEVDYVLHQAALGSVPRSISDPMTSNSANVTGFLNMLCAAKEHNVKSFTYAASSSTYGDHPALPKIEDNIGNPLSPYAVTKLVNELYASVFAKTYGFKAIGLRYFNVFGKRQDPNGAYAAVIPKWTASMIDNKDIFINGDGQTSRDFCYIDNTVQMNILAATANEDSKDQVYNVAVGDRTSLIELFELIRGSLKLNGFDTGSEVVYRDFRAGDVRHSQADISKSEKHLNYAPKYNIRDGIEKAVSWYLNK